MRLVWGWMFLVISAAGCGDASLDTGDGDYMDDDLPMGNCSGTGACPQGPSNPPGSVPVGGPCGDAADCSAGAACMAPWSDGEVGEFTCSAQCVPTDDESMWCLGSASCCDPEATCNARGLCRVGSALDDTAGSEGTASDGGASSTSSGPSSTGSDGSGDSSDGDASTGEPAASSSG
jgi:hypothetical protein